MSVKKDESYGQAMLCAQAHVFPMVFKAAIELNLFGIIAQAGDGAYLSPSEIATKLPTQNPDAPSLIDRILRLFASDSLVSFTLRTRQDGSVERLYGLTPASKFFLRSDDGSCLASMVIHSSHPAVQQAWSALFPP